MLIVALTSRAMETSSSWWTSVWVPALVAALVSVTVAAAFSRISELFRQAWSKVRRDHSTIVTGDFSMEQGGRHDVLCVVRFAPSRRVRQKRLQQSMVGKLAISLAPTVDATPDSSGPDAATFRAPDENQSFCQVSLRSNGLVEVATNLRSIANESSDGRTLVSLADVAHQMARAVLQVRAGHYETAMGIRGRLDWALSVSSYISGPQGTAPVRLLVAGANTAAREAKTANAAFPNPQFGAQALKSTRQRADPAHILHKALDDWLSRSGYWDYEDLLADVIAQAVRRADHEQRRAKRWRND